MTRQSFSEVNAAIKSGRYLAKRAESLYTGIMRIVCAGAIQKNYKIPARNANTKYMVTTQVVIGFSVQVSGFRTIQDLDTQIY